MSHVTLGRAILRLNWTRKKCVKAQEQDEAKRRMWREQAAGWDASQLLFLDECGINTAMHRRYSRAPCGQRAIGEVPRNWKHTTTILGALSPHGVQAVMSLEGPTDRLAFDAFIEQVFLPTLVPGQIIILDNLSAHKSPKAQQLVEAAGCQWHFLPRTHPTSIPLNSFGAPSKTD